MAIDTNFYDDLMQASSRTTVSNRQFPGKHGPVRRIHLLLLTICLALSPAVACSWSATGHQVVAQIAYDRLNPHARKEVDRLIHVLAAFQPRVDNFVPAASWMDMMRGYDMGMWDDLHFISQPYNPDGLKTVRKPSGQNIVWAINQAVKTLEGRHARDFQKALMLRMLIHFVGDVHQPMHTIERYSREVPGGELGGNLFRIKISKAMWKHFRSMNPGNPNRYLMKQPDTLHGLWDEIGLLYPFVNPLDPEQWRKRIPPIAREITERYPVSSLPEVNESDPMAWARESYRVAVNCAYKGVKYNGMVTQAYLDKVQQQATRRIALAGYRLAALLNRIFP